jgi:hypothetical protein
MWMGMRVWNIFSYCERFERLLTRVRSSEEKNDSSKERKIRGFMTEFNKWNPRIVQVDNVIYLDPPCESCHRMIELCRCDETFCEEDHDSNPDWDDAG